MLIGLLVLHGQDGQLAERPRFPTLIGCELTQFALEPLAAANLGQTTAWRTLGRNHRQLSRPRPRD